MATPWDKTWQLLPYRQISAHSHPTFLSLTQRHTQSKGGVDLTHKQTSTKPVSPPQSGIPVRLETHRQSNYTSFTQTPTIVASTNSLRLCYPLIWFQAHIQHGTNLQFAPLSSQYITLAHVGSDIETRFFFFCCGTHWFLGFTNLSLSNTKEITLKKISNKYPVFIVGKSFLMQRKTRIKCEELWLSYFLVDWSH